MAKPGALRRASPDSTLDFEALLFDTEGGEAAAAAWDGLSPAAGVTPMGVDTGRDARQQAPQDAPAPRRDGAAALPAAAAAYASQLAAPARGLEASVAAAAAAFLAQPPAPGTPPRGGGGGCPADVQEALELAACLRAAGFASARAVWDERRAGSPGGAATKAPSPGAGAHATLLQRAARHAFVALDAEGAPRPRAPLRAYSLLGDCARDPHERTFWRRHIPVFSRACSRPPRRPLLHRRAHRGAAPARPLPDAATHARVRRGAGCAARRLRR